MQLLNAAAKALGETNELLAALHAAEAELADVLSKADGLRRRFEAEWQPVVAAASDLLSEARFLHDQVEDGAARRLGELAELRSRADAARREIEEATGVTRGGLESFTARAWDLEPGLVEALDRVAKTGASVEQRAAEVRQALRDTTRQVAELVSGEITADIERMHSDFERRIRGLEVYVTSGCLPRLNERAAALQAKLDLFEENLQRKLEGLGDRIEIASREAAEKCLAGHRELFDRLARIGAQAMVVTEGLRKTVENGATAIGEAKDAIDTRVAGASADLDTAIETLDELMKLLRSYSFIPL